MSLEVPQNAIEAEKLCYSVENRQIISDLDIAVGRSEIVGIIGSSGSGKSTLIKCLSGLLPADSGSLRLYGQQLVGSSERQLAAARARAGYVFQYSALFDSLTVAANIYLAPVRRKIWTKAEARQKVTDTLDLVQLSGVEDYYPSQLSGGMAKRVGLARALALKPQIMFYDEPTSGLDPPTARSIDELIAATRKQLGLTSVVVSHDLAALASLADRIALLDGGRIAMMAPPEEFVASDHPLVRRFVMAESGATGG